MTREVALVGEPRRRRRLRQGHAVGDHLLRLREPPADLVAMRRRAGRRAEMAGQRKAVETGHLLEFLRCHGAMRLGGEELAGAGDRAIRRDPASGARAIVAACDQPAGQALDDGIDGERLQRLREVGESLAQQIGQHGIVGHDIRHEGRTGAVERGRHRGRIDVQHAVGEAVIDAGMSVMRLVGMNDHDLPAAAGLQRAAIVERLRAPQGEADGIGLVAVQIVGMAAEPRRQALQRGLRLVEADLVEAHAQTFKTAFLPCPIWAP